MSTPYIEFYNVFFKKIEQDKNFFMYYNLTAEQAMELAKERAKGYLHESLLKLTLETESEINFGEYDDVSEVVNADCTNNEKIIVGNLMFEMYLEKDFAKLKSNIINFSPSDLKVFSPSDERRSFLSLYKQVQDNNIIMIDKYNSKDRLTGKRKTIDYNSYSEYEV